MSQNPYASPSQNSTGESPHNLSGYQYIPLNLLAKILSFSVGIICLVNLLISAMDTVGSFLFPNFLDSQILGSSDLEQYFTLAMLGIGLLNAPAFILSVVCTTIFFYRANANLRSLKVRGLQHTPGWCGGYWFIPIINLIKPYQVAAEINNRSRSKGTHKQPSSYVGIWWTCWIISNILSNIEIRLALSEVETGTSGLILSWVATLFTCCAGLLFIKVIFAFANAQEELQNTPKQPEQTPSF